MLDDFGELRSLVHGAPSRGAWDELCRWIERQDETQQRQWLPYIQTGLASWPAALRCAPQAWLDTALERPVLALSLVRWIRCRAPTSSEAWLRWGQLAELEHVEGIDASATGLKRAGLKALWSAPCFARIKHLNLRQNPLAGALIGVLSIPRQPTLVELSLSACALRHEDIDALAQSAALANLERLDLSRCELDDESITRHLSSPHLGRLKRLDLSANTLGLEAARAISQTRALGALEELRLYYTDCDILPELRAILATSEHLPRAVADSFRKLTF